MNCCAPANCLVILQLAIGLCSLSIPELEVHGGVKSRRLGYKCMSLQRGLTDI